MAAFWASRLAGSCCAGPIPCRRCRWIIPICLWLVGRGALVRRAVPLDQWRRTAVAAPLARFDGAGNPSERRNDLSPPGAPARLIQPPLRVETPGRDWRGKRRRATLRRQHRSRPHIMSASTTETLPGDSGLARRLSREIQGEVLFDRASRGRYSTDALHLPNRATGRDRAALDRRRRRRAIDRARVGHPGAAEGGGRASAARP